MTGPAVLTPIPCRAPPAAVTAWRAPVAGRVREDPRLSEPFVDWVVHVVVDPEPRVDPRDHGVEVRSESEVERVTLEPRRHAPGAWRVVGHDGDWLDSASRVLKLSLDEGSVGAVAPCTLPGREGLALMVDRFR